MARMAEAGGPTKAMPAAAAGVGEVGVLGQEAVARVDRPGAGPPRGIEQLGGDQIGLAGGRGTDQNGLVGQPDMAGVGIRLGMDGDGADSHAAGGPDDPAGDFSAVGDQQFFKHGWLPAENSPGQAAPAGV
jgi:hypothetical protein